MLKKLGLKIDSGLRNEIKMELRVASFAKEDYLLCRVDEEQDPNITSGCLENMFRLSPPRSAHTYFYIGSLLYELRISPTNLSQTKQV